MSEDKKKCPGCAEEIPANATICPVCNEKLQQQQSARPSESKPNKLKIGAIIGTALALVFILYCCFANEYEIELSRLQERDNLYYEVGEKSPFTGVAVGPNGMDYNRFKKGKRHGTSEEFYNDGTEKLTMNFSHGLLDGEQLSYYTNGQPQKKRKYKQGRILSDITYDSDGNVEEDISYKYKKDIQTKTERDGQGRVTLVENYNIKTERLDGERLTYLDGNICGKENYRNGEQHGEQLTYNSNGKIIDKSTYKDGVLHGEQMHSFDNSGLIWKVENYKDGKLDGLQIEYHRNGKIREKKNITANSGRSGESYYEDGKPESKFNYDKDGRLVPESSFWDPKGHLKRRITVGPSDIIIEETYTYHPNGKLAQIERTLPSSRTRHGDQEKYFENGQLKSKETFILDKENGERILYNQDGTVSAKWQYKDGKTIQEERFYPDGKIASREIQENGRFVKTIFANNGKILKRERELNRSRDGKQEEYYENGKPKSESNYLNGSKNGLQTQWYENGTVAVQSNFQKGERHGDETRYFPSGKVQLKSNYQQGKLDGDQLQYDESGNITRKSSFSENQEESRTEYTYFPDGKVSSEKNFMIGSSTGKLYKHGIWFEYTAPSQLKYKIEFNRDEIVSGEKYEYYATGSIQKKVLLNQKKEEETHYYPNGKIQLQTILTRERGGDSAESFGYHENGQLKFHESYQDYGRGLVKDGPRMEYDTDGKVIKAEIFWRGRGKAMVICSQCKKYTDPDKYACMHCRKGWKTNRKGK
ncbi:MAG: hypothetical protein MR727_03505 [Lentisphaeria bacterium]|nr:hypothetical protein [Lentisphaeria bacterium]